MSLTLESTVAGVASGRVQGKTALITGAASAAGMGFATACALAREGAQVVLTDLDGPQVSERAEELRQRGYRAVGMHQDVTDEEHWATVIGAVGRELGALDILVNNAGCSILKPIESLTVRDFELQLRTNLTSVFLGCRSAVIDMRRRRAGGSIVNIASLASDVGMPNGAAYSASKGGVRQITKTVALECAREGIRCNSIHPGLILTQMHEVGWRDNPEGMKAFESAIPMGRMGRPEDIAYCALFLASDESKYITGADFVVDGGLLAQ